MAINLINYKEKKWCWITALYAKWAAPDPNEIWTRNSERNFTRLIQSPAYHVNFANEIDFDKFDIFVLVNFNMEDFEKEIDFLKKVKQAGKKSVLCFSADYRFTLGNCLANSKGTIYTDLCEHADVILSGMPEEFGLFGRYQEKVLPWALPLERKNFSLSYNHRIIDMAFSSSAGEESFAFNLELMLMFKQRHPDMNILYTLHDQHKDWIKLYQNRGIDFKHIDLMDYLPKTKVYVNTEVRIRGGRAMEEAWHCRTPFISSDATFYNKIFPQFSFNKLNMKNIVDMYDEIIASDYNTLIKEAELRVEPLYFDNMVQSLVDKIYK